MERDIIKELIKECNWHEKAIIRIFKKLSTKIYKMGVKRGFNWNIIK